MTHVPADSREHPTRRTAARHPPRAGGATEGDATVIGVDGCRGGWIAVQWGASVQYVLCRRFEDVLALEGSIIAIDRPIGFQDIASPGGRDAEKHARQILKQKSSSVFPTPARAALAGLTHREASDLHKKNSTTGDIGLTIYTFGLFRKMREIDALMTPDLQRRVHESHPEVAFALMNGDAPVIASKKTASGREARLALLERGGFPIAALPPLTCARKDVGLDDLIDACACAWAARRIQSNTARRLPPDPPRDAKGLRMEINA